MVGVVFHGRTQGVGGRHETLLNNFLTYYLFISPPTRESPGKWLEREGILGTHNLRLWNVQESMSEWVGRCPYVVDGRCPSEKQASPRVTHDGSTRTLGTTKVVRFEGPRANPEGRRPRGRVPRSGSSSRGFRNRKGSERRVRVESDPEGVLNLGSERVGVK